MVASNTMNIAKRFTSIFAVVAVSASLGAAVPAASAGSAMADTTVTATRSFPKTTAASVIFSPSTHPRMLSPTPIGVASKVWMFPRPSLRQKRTERLRSRLRLKLRLKHRRLRLRHRRRLKLRLPSRSSERADISSVPTAPASATGQALADYALQFQGYPYVSGGNTPSGWDCSGFVQWVFAQFGVSLPHYSGAQMSVGTAVGSIAEAAPGDIIVNTQHAAIYIGNGMVINALNPAQGTQVTSLAVFSGGYAIRRVL